jgi:hypothetical protein
MSNGNRICLTETIISLADTVLSLNVMIRLEFGNLSSRLKMNLTKSMRN